MKEQAEADLILKLYELRQAPILNEARKWCVWALNVKAANDFFNIMMGENGDRLHMVYSYWDMAASLVESGAINEKLFNKMTDEHMLVFALIEPVLDDIRSGMDNPNYLINLEAVIRRIPGHKEMLEKKRQKLKAMKAIKTG